VADITNLTLTDHSFQVKPVRDKILALCSGLAMPSSEPILNDSSFVNSSVAGSANLTLIDHSIQVKPVQD
jgi:hypothetical protein